MRNTALSLLFILSLADAADAGILDRWLTPKLTAAQKEWQVSHRDVATTDPNYPLQVLSDGYKMINTYRSEERKLKYGNTVPAENYVHWGWKLTVRNKSSRKLRVSVTYELKDKDGFGIAKAYASAWIDAGMTATIQDDSSMPYDRLDRLRSSGWTINFSEKALW